jgi:hypothetical protein
MPESIDLTLEQIKLSLSGYQSELDKIDAETVQEKESILNAIRAEEAEIKSLLAQYRNIKRQKEVELVKSSYNNLSSFKQALLSKIDSEKVETKTINTKAINTNNREFLIESSSPIQVDHHPELEGGVPKKIEKQFEENQSVNQKVKIIELIQFIEGMNAQDLIKFYPDDVANIIPGFKVNNTEVKDGLLEYYQKRDLDIYQSLLKLYQKPELNNTVPIPNSEGLSIADRKYDSFLRTNYPKSLPFFWFLVNREKDTIRYAVMEFSVDHIIQTNTLDNDPNRLELTLKLPELLEMKNQTSVYVFLRDLFLCFHPHRVSQKGNSKNKYFDYVNNLIKTQSTLEHSEILRFWGHLIKSGYNTVGDENFAMVQPENNYHNGLTTASPKDLL